MLLRVHAYFERRSPALIRIWHPNEPLAVAVRPYYYEIQKTDRRIGVLIEHQ